VASCGHWTDPTTWLLITQNTITDKLLNVVDKPWHHITHMTAWLSLKLFPLHVIVTLLKAFFDVHSTSVSNSLHNILLVNSMSRLTGYQPLDYCTPLCTHPMTCHTHSLHMHHIWTIVFHLIAIHNAFDWQYCLDCVYSHKNQTFLGILNQLPQAHLDVFPSSTATSVTSNDVVLKSPSSWTSTTSSRHVNMGRRVVHATKTSMTTSAST